MVRNVVRYENIQSETKKFILINTKVWMDFWICTHFHLLVPQQLPDARKQWHDPTLPTAVLVPAEPD